MFFSDKKGGGGIASAILTSAKSKFGSDAGPPEPAPPEPGDHELLTHTLLDAVHKRDMQGTHDALHALWTHFQARQEAEGRE